MRVLALTTSTPEVLPGAAVSIQPLLSDVRGAGRSLTYTVVACTDPGVAFGNQPDCEHDSDRQSLGPFNATLTAPYYTELQAAFSITIPASLFTTQRTNPFDQFNGAQYLVRVVVTASDGSTTSAFRRIRVSGAPKLPKNSNPSITAILGSSGQTLSTVPNESMLLTAQLASSAAESYLYLKTDGTTETRTENLTVAWYTSEGSLDSNRLAPDSPNQYSVATSPSYPTFLVVVATDDRGGSSFLRLTP
jgi:hypothetical protein